MRRCLGLPLLGLALLGALPARAAPLLARYEVRAAGLPVMQVDALLELDGPRYAVRTRIRTLGVAALFSTSDQVTFATGTWQGNVPRPSAYRVEGVWRGGPREVAMDWTPAGMPRLQALVPPEAGEREAVPDSLRQGTMDALSALALLTRTVAATGRCDAVAHVYDGRRRADYTARTEGPAPIPEGLGFQGQALRCGLEARLIAGRRADQDPEEAQRPQPATAWMADLGQGRPPLPVAVDLPSRWFGSVRARLLGVETVPPQRLAAALAEFGQQRR
ncbi:DUF3108 domain-containing protein [Siccirubricoccus sp. KC 17139]|uniref:DUF3108 domain-containing protein n=1 Tax=Siccirubricoccus soli TaxID=2899147 RepID=A0ABT1D416_9PROT|nr:DUF3108 domain-containing protein [Siccirubricoccus soli]MCO6416614.1 DUF3108 domain-containing protein [Siccirubricoccus soli]MCP2682749.1 DUF3108 domain-containing protein [Siccirubricoccus soli]